MTDNSEIKMVRQIMAIDILWLASPALIAFGTMWLTGATFLAQLVATMSLCYPLVATYFVFMSRDYARATFRVVRLERQLADLTKMYVAHLRQGGSADE